MKIIVVIISALLVVAGVSCTKVETGGTDGMGTLSLNLSLDAQTKAVENAEALMQTATVKIYLPDFGGLTRSYVYSDMPSAVYLAEGAGYRVDVEAGEAVASEPAAASWTSKSYKGSESFDIVAGQVKTVEVVANISNAVTSISFDQTVAKNFTPGYAFTIGLGESANLVYDESKSGDEGYFLINGLVDPSFAWTFNGTLAKDGSSVIKTGVIEGIQPGKMYKMSVKYTIKDGDVDFTVSVDFTTVDVFDEIVFEPVSTGLAASSVYETWATRTTFHADVDPVDYAGASVIFEYSSDNGNSWKQVSGVSESEGVWKADVRNLTPSTTYRYRLMLNGEQAGEEMTFTTEAAPNLPNASFEYASLVSGKDYYKFYDPYCGVEEGKTMFWGSGNGEGSEGVNGSANMGIIITKIDTGNKKHGKQSVLAETGAMSGFLAAGNIFTGNFAGLVGTEGGKVNFGRPWTSRPTAMRIWCMYETDKMDIINGMPAGVNLTTSDYDRAQIKVALGKWDYKKYGGTKESPILVNTTDESTFVDFYTDANTIANGDLIIYNNGYSINKGNKVSATTSGWIEYIIPLDYRNLNTYPTHIVVSCASSQYGDYFTGNKGSKLWVDAIELIYE